MKELNLSPFSRNEEEVVLVGSDACSELSWAPKVSKSHHVGWLHPH